MTWADLGGERCCRWPAPCEDGAGHNSARERQALPLPLCPAPTVLVDVWVLPLNPVVVFDTLKPPLASGEIFSETVRTWPSVRVAVTFSSVTSVFVWKLVCETIFVPLALVKVLVSLMSPRERGGRHSEGNGKRSKQKRSSGSYEHPNDVVAPITLPARGRMGKGTPRIGNVQNIDPNLAILLRIRKS